MCSKNRIGPKTVPCGTPESTVTRSDCIPSTTTRCFRKLEIQVQILLPGEFHCLNCRNAVEVCENARPA